MRAGGRACGGNGRSRRGACARRRTGRRPARADVCAARRPPCPRLPTSPHRRQRRLPTPQTMRSRPAGASRDLPSTVYYVGEGVIDCEEGFEIEAHSSTRKTRKCCSPRMRLSPAVSAAQRSVAAFALSSVLLLPTIGLAPPALADGDVRADLSRCRFHGDSQPLPVLPSPPRRLKRSSSLPSTVRRKTVASSHHRPWARPTLHGTRCMICANAQ